MNEIQKIFFLDFYYYAYVIQTLDNDSFDLFPIRLGSPHVQAAILISLTTLMTIILGFIFKEYWIPGWIDNRRRRRDGQELFKRYKSDMFYAGHALMKRLEEIFQNRSHYLIEGAPKSKFYDYKYKSSVYRLCLLLGLIRFFKSDEPFIVTKHSSKKRVVQAIAELQKVLADGQNMEMFIVRKLVEFSRIDKRKFNYIHQGKLAIDTDHLIQKFLVDRGIDIISKLPPYKQDLFIDELKLLVEKNGGSGHAVEENKLKIIEMISLRTILIYRDWQMAIGDMMLEKVSAKDASYKIIGYGEFERIANRGEDANNIWVTRCEGVFKDLNTTLNLDVDSRGDQLRSLYSCLYNLIKELNEIDIGGQLMNRVEFDTIPSKLS